MGHNSLINNCSQSCAALKITIVKRILRTLIRKIIIIPKFWFIIRTYFWKIIDLCVWIVMWRKKTLKIFFIKNRGVNFFQVIQSNLLCLLEFSVRFLFDGLPVNREIFSDHLDLTEPISWIKWCSSYKLSLHLFQLQTLDRCWDCLRRNCDSTKGTFFSDLWRIDPNEISVDELFRVSLSFLSHDFFGAQERDRV